MAGCYKWEISNVRHVSALSLVSGVVAFVPPPRVVQVVCVPYKHSIGNKTKPPTILRKQQVAKSAHAEFDATVSYFFHFSFESRSS